MRSSLLSHTLAAIACVALFACSDPPTKSGDNSSPNNTTANNISPNNAQNGCTGPAPGCGVCFAPVCQDGVWGCEGTPCAQPACDGVDPPDCAAMCAGGFSDCDGSQWSCICPPSDCAGSGESTLSGASIVMTADRCVWTLAEAAAGITIGYSVVIDEAHQITMTSQQNFCDEPGPSGLGPFPRIFGVDQNYCICDTGLCNDQPQTATLVPGTYDFSVVWSGRNWNGPSDTGNPEGEPFPAGEYTVEVTALGSNADLPYAVVGRMVFELTE